MTVLIVIHSFLFHLLHPTSFLRNFVWSRKPLQNYRKSCVANYELKISLIRSSDKPPTDPKEREKHRKQRDKYFSYQKLYGDSLVGGVDKARIITVEEEVPKNKGKKKVPKNKGKKKDGKMVGIFVIIKLLSKFFAVIVFYVFS